MADGSSMSQANEVPSSASSMDVSPVQNGTVNQVS